MNYQQAQHIMSIVQATYEGGLQEFMEDKGAFVFVPAPFDILLAHIPEGHQDLKDKIAATGNNIRFVEEENFSFYVEDLTEAERAITEYLSKSLGEEALDDCLLRVTPLGSLMSVPHIRKDSEEARQFEEHLRGMEGHARSYIVYKNGEHTELVFKSAQKVTPSVVEHRDVPLSEDDVLNVSIALNTCETVEDFLNNL